MNKLLIYIMFWQLSTADNVHLMPLVMCIECRGLNASNAVPYASSAVPLCIECRIGMYRMPCLAPLFSVRSSKKDVHRMPCLNSD